MLIALSINTNYLQAVKDYVGYIRYMYEKDRDQIPEELLRELKNAKHCLALQGPGSAGSSNI